MIPHFVFLRMIQMNCLRIFRFPILNKAIHHANDPYRELGKDKQLTFWISVFFCFVRAQAGMMYDE